MKNGKYGGELRGTKKLRRKRKVNAENKRCRQCPREKIKHMRGEIKSTKAKEGKTDYRENKR